MAESTGPILAIGAITWANRVIIAREPLPDRAGVVSFTVKVAVGTGIAAAILATVERASRDVAVAMSWLAFLTMMLARVDPAVPSPTESILRWWNER